MSMPSGLEFILVLLYVIFVLWTVVRIITKTPSLGYTGLMTIFLVFLALAVPLIGPLAGWIATRNPEA